ncbi:MAG: hypothetical protein NTNFB02_32960 [Nitrospira sp.]
MIRPKGPKSIRDGSKVIQVAFPPIQALQQGWLEAARLWSERGARAADGASVDAVPVRQSTCKLPQM